ncbi:hypothetical protein ACE14D_19420 [Streptomyces sp. Act-28]
MAPSAHADVAGAFSGTEWTVRAQPTTASAAVLRVKPLHKGTPDTVECWNNCSPQVQGGTYRCTSSGKQYKTWRPLKYNGRKYWVADECVSFGRIA